MTETHAEELRRRDPRFLRILSTNTAEGTGEYEARSLTTGRVATLAFTFEGDRVLTPKFDEEFLTRAAADGRAPDPYAQGLQKLRAATATDATRFEDRYKADRLRELAAEYERLAANAMPRLTTAEAAARDAALAEFAAPQPYDLAIKALREKEARR